MPTMSDKLEKAVSSNVLTLIARACMMASVPIALWIADGVRDQFKEQKAQTEVIAATVDAKLGQLSDKVDAKIDSTNKRVDGVGDAAKTIADSVQTINTTIAEGLRQTIDSQGKRIETLERNVDGLRDRVDIERDRVTTLNGDVKVLQEMSKIKSPQGSVK